MVTFNINDARFARIFRSDDLEVKKPAVMIMEPKIQLTEETIDLPSVTNI